MPNKTITMNKLKTIIRLYEARTGLKPIAEMVHITLSRSISTLGTVCVRKNYNIFFLIFVNH